MNLLSAFFGVIIGAAIAFLTTWIQVHYNYKNNMRKLALNIGLEYFKCGIDLSKYAHEKTGQEQAVCDLSSFVFYAHEILKLIDKNKLTPENLKIIISKTREIEKVKDIQEKQEQSK